jgi:ribonucleoside-diphosphate reductase alpha chain
MSLDALRSYTFVSRYARFDPSRRRRETWPEAIDRVTDMHRRKYPEVQSEIEWAFRLVRQKRVLGSQRALQFAGQPIEENHARIYNCTASFCDRIRFFQECFWLLLCGCGTGFSVQRHHVAKLPEFTDSRLNQQTPRPLRKFCIYPTIESWADALGVLLASYFPHPEFPAFANADVEFTFADRRVDKLRWDELNADSLASSLQSIRAVLDRCLAAGQRRLRPIDAYDIVMLFSQAVLCGGVRRSASICVFSPDDDDMLDAKTGNWYYDHPHRAGSNNSCLLLRGQTSFEQFRSILQKVREYGEPGFVWADSTEYLVNPCCEIGFWPVDEETGASGWAVCNLTEINGAKVKNKADFARAARAAAIIGTLQAGYTDFPYLGPTTERIVRREALLGVSITGVMENAELLLDPAVQREMAELVKQVNAEIAQEIGIRPAARCTCIKPAGASSCLLGTSSGIHPHHARRYFRRVQASKLEAPFQHFARRNPSAVEDSVWHPGSDHGVVTFCVEAPARAKIKSDFTAVAFLELIKSTQQNWVIPGTRPEACTRPWLTHNVSNTVWVKEHEWEAVADFIYRNRAFFTGVSLLPASGDKEYPQAPMCAVLEIDEIVAEYGPGVFLAESLVAAATAAFAGSLWTACDALRGKGRNFVHSASQRAWLDQAAAYAKEFFQGDLTRTSNCLKDVANYRLWVQLKKSYRPVDYTQMLEDADETTFLAEPACAGGACLV